MNNNIYQKQVIRGLKRKIALIDYKGGKCEKCGYKKCFASLEFHHINPDDKEFQLDLRHLSNMNFEKILKEADKCMLLCSNCHREIHHPELTLENVSNILIENDEQKTIETLRKKHKTTICLNCGKEFKFVKGKKFCCDKCRNEYKKYPSKDEVILIYDKLKSWQKVADYFNLTRKIIQNIRKGKN